MMQRDEAINVQGGVAPILVNIDKSLGKQFLLVLWLTSFVSAAAVIAFVFMIFAFNANSAKLGILQYDHNTMRAELEVRGVLPSKNEAGH